MNERIKELRLELGLTQEEFGRRLGVTRGAITNIELNKVDPKPLFVSLICREFNVNEQWLRTGEGDKSRPKGRNEELFTFFNAAVEDPDSIKVKLLTVMARLDESQWEVLDRVAHMLAEEVQKEKADQK